jgi:hypothetical protein
MEDILFSLIWAAAFNVAGYAISLIFNFFLSKAADGEVTHVSSRPRESSVLSVRYNAGISSLSLRKATKKDIDHLHVGDVVAVRYQLSKPERFWLDGLGEIHPLADLLVTIGHRLLIVGGIFALLHFLAG